MTTYFTLGTDTELFAVDKDGQHRALCGLIGGTKDEPKQMEELFEGFAYQEDNVAVEFNIPPAGSRYDWLYFVKTARNRIEDMLKKEHGLSIAKDCAVSFDKKELEHPTALVFGCEPDYDAWKLVENKKPSAKDPHLRTAGGHIHVGTDHDMISGVQKMDLFLGVPSIILDDSPASIARRELYGKAGAMRPKPYGWEYRTLSNFWVFDDKLIEWVYNSVYFALNKHIRFTKKAGESIRHCINTGDKELAEKLISSYGIVMP